jgi:hypothetical protein
LTSPRFHDPYGFLPEASHGSPDQQPLCLEILSGGLGRSEVLLLPPVGAQAVRIPAQGRRQRTRFLPDSAAERCRPPIPGIVDRARAPRIHEGKQSGTRSRCRWMSASRCGRIEGPVGLDPVSARGSSRTACQYSGGISSPGPGVRPGGTFPRTAAACASFSICFGVGMRQLAGRSVIPRIEHTKNEGVESAEGRNPKN